MFLGTELALAACTPASPLYKAKHCGMSTAVGEGISTSEGVSTSLIKLANEAWSDNIWASTGICERIQSKSSSIIL